MINENKTLWKKIESFQLDEPNANFPFSKKLAKENNWSQSFTNRAIEEYKKFIYLCCISPTGASPSEVVDKVWHLHLTYTISYWDEFCSKTLERPLHHHPSKGGNDEHRKHDQWYFETLQLYEAIFKLKPPSNIWPSPISILKKNFPYPFSNSSFSKLIPFIAVYAVPFFIVLLLYDHIDPFSLPGPDFLVFFLFLSIAIIANLIILNNSRQQPLLDFVEKYLPNDIHLYQAIYALYGGHRTLQTAILDLVNKNWLTLQSNNYFGNNTMFYNTGNSTNPLLPGLKTLNNAEDISYDTLYYSAMDFDSLQHGTLYQMKHIMRTSDRQKYILLAVGLLIGLSRIIQGVANHRPVGYLIIMMFFLSVVFILIAVALDDSTYLQNVIKDRISNDANCQAAFEGNDYLMQNFYKTGPGALKHYDEYAALATMFAIYTPTKWYSVIGSDISSGGCSSSSCGGGGCGGGGCGGCGG